MRRVPFRVFVAMKRPSASAERARKKRPSGVRSSARRSRGPSPAVTVLPAVSETRQDDEGWWSGAWDETLSGFRKALPRTGQAVEAIIDCDGRVETLQGCVRMLKASKGGQRASIAITTSSMPALDALTGKDEIPVHFCRSPDQCDDLGPGVYHIAEWRVLPDSAGDAPPTPRGATPSSAKPPDGTASGVPLFGREKQLEELKQRISTDNARLKEMRQARDRAHSGDEARKAGVPLLGDRIEPARGVDTGSKGAADGSGAPNDQVNVNSLLAERAARHSHSPEHVSHSLSTGESRKEKKRQSGHDVESVSSGDSGDEGTSQVFREAPSLFKGSRIQKMADLRGGSLLENGVSMMSKALRAHLRGGESSNGPNAGQLRSVVTSYLTQALMPACASNGQTFGLRNEREMRTLAEALDALVDGRLAAAGDLMMQRFRACEAAVLDGGDQHAWSMAKHLELIPPHRVTSIPNGMRTEVMREENAEAKLLQRRRVSAVRGRPGMEE